MLRAAHASRWHWAQTGVPDINQRLAVGEWQCSRVYAVLGRGEPSLHHARRCVELVEADDMEDWVAASAYEAMARAFARPVTNPPSRSGVPRRTPPWPRSPIRRTGR